MTTAGSGEAKGKAVKARAPSIGFITVCRGRLHHLQQTLPLILAQQPDEVIVVDHECPQGTGAWVEANHPSVRVVMLRDGLPFLLARARNAGISQSTADILCIIDADILVQPGFVDWIRGHAGRRIFFRHAASPTRHRDRETWGTMICPRKLLTEIGLYDEAFDGWGGEDDDIYYRLRTAGSAESYFPFPLIKAIHHEDTERFALYPQKDKRIQMLVSRVYSDAKKLFLTFLRPTGDLPLDLRLHLRSEAKKAVFDAAAKRTVRLSLSHRSTVLRDYGLDKTLTLVMKIDGPLSQTAAGSTAKTPRVE